ncbi:MAG: PAS domain S-box protein [Phycisphaeraceae bacterium]
MTSERREADESRGGATLGTPILQAVLDPLLVLDEDFRVSMANDAFCDAFESPREQVIGRSFFELHDGAWNSSEIRQCLEATASGGKSFKSYEIDHDFESLGRRTMLLNASRHTIGGVAQAEKPIILLAMKDITERKQAEEKLREREQQLRTIFDNAVEFAIITMDLDGKVNGWNGGAQRLLGYEASEILGKDARIIFTKEDRESGAADRELRLALETGRAENERWHLRKDGSLFWGSGLVMPLRRDGQPHGLMKIMRDLTDRHRLEIEREERAKELQKRVEQATAESQQRAEKLQRLTEHLHEVEKLERERLGQVLHDDLQQLLVAANMRVQQIHPPPDEAPIVQEVRKLVNAAIDSARSLSHELNPKMLRDRGLVAALHWLADNMRDRYQLKVVIEADEGVAKEIPEDIQDTLFQMVRELLFNVVKHAQASKAWIKVRSTGEGHIQVTVEDDGVGCSQQHINEEAGLGLRSIRERLLIWEGELKASVRPAGGCCMTIEIPRG